MQISDNMLSWHSETWQLKLSLRASFENDSVWKVVTWSCDGTCLLGNSVCGCCKSLMPRKTLHDCWRHSGWIHEVMLFTINDTPVNVLEHLSGWFTQQLFVETVQVLVMVLFTCSLAAGGKLDIVFFWFSWYFEIILFNSLECDKNKCTEYWVCANGVHLFYTTLH